MMYGSFNGNCSDSISPLMTPWIRWRFLKPNSLKDYFNPLRAKFFKGNINIYLHFVSLLHIDMAQVLKILSQVRLGLTSYIFYIVNILAADVLAT